MRDLIRLSESQMRRVKRYFALSHGVINRQRHKVENMFGKLKDWRRIQTRYDCAAHTFMSACIAATGSF